LSAVSEACPAETASPTNFRFAPAFGLGTTGLAFVPAFPSASFVVGSLLVADVEGFFSGGGDTDAFPAAETISPRTPPLTHLFYALCGHHLPSNASLP
jgi:hypothetical protein